MPGHTFIAIFVVDRKIKLGTISKSTLDDDVALKLEDRDASTIEFNSGGFLLGLEFEKHRGRHRSLPEINLADILRRRLRLLVRVKKTWES
jgi:hypothetical protein